MKFVPHVLGQDAQASFNAHPLVGGKVDGLNDKLAECAVEGSRGTDKVGGVSGGAERTETTAWEDSLATLYILGKGLEVLDALIVIVLAAFHGQVST
jgi:hypothetical protein